MPPPVLPDGVTLEVIGPEADGVALRIFTPARPSGAALLWIHGGGFVLGGAAQDDVHNARLAAEQSITVIAPEYRFAPEHPFPAPLDDCEAAWRWLLEHSLSRGIDLARLAIGGQSAGGGLAAGLVLQLVGQQSGSRPGGAPPDGRSPSSAPQAAPDSPRPVLPRAQWLFSPMLDDRTALRTELDAVRFPVWDNRSNRAGWSAYLPCPIGSPDVPGEAAPARTTDLAGLPPTWIGTSDIELFYEEDCAYAEALGRSDVDTTLDVVRGASHGFESIRPGSDLVLRYRRRAEEWLAERLS